MVARKIRVGVGLMTLTVAALGYAQHARRPALPSSHAVRAKTPTPNGVALLQPAAAQAVGATGTTRGRPRTASLRADVDDYNRSHPIPMPVFRRPPGGSSATAALAPDANQPIALRLSGAPYEH